MQRWLDHAVKIAGDNDNHFKHGAVLVKGGRVLAYAPNILKNPPTLFQREFPENPERQKIQIRKHCSTHAEARVVKIAGENARGSVVYVARVNNQGQTMMSRPCDDCYHMLVEAGVKAVVYTDSVESAAKAA